MQQLYNSDYFHITYSSVNIISYVKKTRTLLYFNLLYTYMICVTRNIYIILFAEGEVPGFKYDKVTGFTWLFFRN